MKSFVYVVAFLGENLQQTLHRLGIDLPENVIHEHNF